MAGSFEQALVEVWLRVLVENAEVVLLDTERYPVQLTPKVRLRQVHFVIEGSKVRGVEQNHATKSRWAQMARSGRKVMQFLDGGRYIANVVDGEGVPQQFARHVVRGDDEYRNAIFRPLERMGHATASSSPEAPYQDSGILNCT